MGSCVVCVCVLVVGWIGAPLPMRAHPHSHPSPPPPGPLEATIASLQRELESRGSDGRDLQRRWLAAQGGLLGVQVRGGEGGCRVCRWG